VTLVRTAPAGRFGSPPNGNKPTMSTNGNGHGAMVSLGEAALTGWRGNVGRAIAKPIAKKTRFDIEQIEAALGFILLAYTIYRLARPLLEAARRR